MSITLLQGPPQPPRGSGIEAAERDHDRRPSRPAIVLRRVIRNQLAQSVGFASYREMIRKAPRDREVRQELRRLVDELATEASEATA
jgi:hypothetical protein